MKIKFCGAVNEVTGSCHLVTTDKHQILLDCGMFQGGKKEEAQNTLLLISDFLSLIFLR